jgi:hypothetical protein
MANNWCTLFERDDYEVIAFYNDLKGYLKKSYGHPEINSNMAYLILKDAIENMERHVKKTELNR